MINFERINEMIDMSLITPYLNDIEFINYYNADIGKEHYKLLSYISHIHDNINIIDLGTYKGASAIALSYNITNSVYSFDIVDSRTTNDKSNVKYIIDDITNGNYDDLIVSSHVIVLDVAHTGVFEDLFLNYLISLNWKGLLIIDDIHLNNEMKHFFSSISVGVKNDISEYGHYTGTGIIYM